MTLLAPAALVALLIPAAVYLIHWLFGSRRRFRVPATFLWVDLPQTSAGRARRKIPPFSALLLLQLVAAILAALALARPATPEYPPRHLALILDASASIQATDVAPSRFEAGRGLALERLAGLPPSDHVTVIRAGREASIVAASSPDNARTAIGTALAGNGGSAIREALILASAEIARTPEWPGQILLVTDVAWPAPEPTGPLAAPVEVVTVGGGSNNQAITSVVTRMDPTGRGQTTFVELVNYADRAVRVPVRLIGDGSPLDERQIDIVGHGQAQLSIPVPVETRHITVRLLGRDALGLDDVVETIAPGGPPRDVLLVGRVSEGVRRAVESIPSLHTRSAETPGANLTSAELTVLQGVLPVQLPNGPLLLVNPPATSARLVGVGLGSGARRQPGHALLQGLDLAALQAETPGITSVPGWAKVVLGTSQGPLLMEGRMEGHPVVALTFDPSTSGLEKSLAFPMLIGNATSFLISQADAGSPTSEPFDPPKSDIAPRPIPTFAIVTSSAHPQENGSRAFDHPSAAQGTTDRAPWFIAAALMVLGAEWLVFARRG